MATIRRRSAALVLGGVSLAAGLAGCASTTAQDSGTSGGSGSSSGSGSSTGSGTYTDGTYDATGEYQSPGGAESIEVQLTLKGNVVTKVSVTGDASSGNAERYQTEFEDGISDVVVGRNIDDISVDKVAGSSLTSDGFTAALDQIKADATA